MFTGRYIVTTGNVDSLTLDLHVHLWGQGSAEFHFLFVHVYLTTTWPLNDYIIHITTLI